MLHRAIYDTEEYTKEVIEYYNDPNIQKKQVKILLRTAVSISVNIWYRLMNYRPDKPMSDNIYDLYRNIIYIFNKITSKAYEFNVFKCILNDVNNKGKLNANISNYSHDNVQTEDDKVLMIVENL